jgi:hypothetical protein
MQFIEMVRCQMEELEGGTMTNPKNVDLEKSISDLLIKFQMAEPGSGIVPIQKYKNPKFLINGIYLKKDLDAEP